MQGGGAGAEEFIMTNIFVTSHKYHIAPEKDLRCQEITSEGTTSKKNWGGGGGTPRPAHVHFAHKVRS